MLSGEGGLHIGCPNVLILPASIHQGASIVAMTTEQFINNVKEKGTEYNYPLLARSNISDTTKLLQIEHIPPFLVYNGFEKDLDAEEFIERILDMDRDGGGQEITLNLQQFLLSCLSSHNTNNPRP